MTLTDAQMSQILGALRKASDRPRCSKTKIAMIVILSVILGALLGELL